MDQKQDIEKEHPEYVRHVNQWTKCRDIIEGSECVKEKGEKYLPKLPGQSDTDYKAYKHRAIFYEATGRTLEGLSGLVMGKAPRVEAPAGVKGILEDCDLRGRPFTALCEDAIEEVLTVGRFGIMVDHPPAQQGITRDMVEPLGLRPYVIRVEAESIINWEYSRIANRWKLSRIVIREDGCCDDGNPDKIYRELLLVNGFDETGQDRTEFHLRVWTRAKIGETYVPGAPVIPIKNGAPLTEIPFFFAGVEFGDEDPDRPPLLGLAELNLHHYMTSADKRHALFHCGLPTPVFAGFVFEDGKEVSLGGPSGITSPDPNAKAYYLEFSGQGIQPLKEELEALEGMMAKLGARMLAEDKKQAEAAETLKIRASGESSTLASIAESVSKTLTQVLALMCDWAGMAGEVVVRLNTDFQGKGMSSQDVVALTQALIANKIPLREYLYTLLENGKLETERSGDVLDILETEVRDNQGSDGFNFGNNPPPNSDPASGGQA